MSGKLPDTLHELLAQALADLRACEADERYRVDMKFWHWKGANDEVPCLVSLPGAWMAKTLGADPGKVSHPSQWPEQERARIHVLNGLLEGRLNAAWSNMPVMDGVGVPPPSEELMERYDCGPPSYELYPDDCWAWMEALQADLEKAGL